jgi:tagatose 1,6-diphosphate aldolase
MKVKITRGKFEGINTCADSHGVIAALAVDHRGNLLEAMTFIRKAVCPTCCQNGAFGAW